MCTLGGGVVDSTTEAGRTVVQNMTASQRIVPVKVIDENRCIVNLDCGLQGIRRVSYTHLITWGILKAIEAVPVLNSAFAEKGGEPVRIQHKRINIGIAVDLPGEGGGRSLVVPNLKNTSDLDFESFVSAYDSLIARARWCKGETSHEEDYQPPALSPRAADLRQHHF